MKKEILITPTDLLKFMTTENYKGLIDEILERINKSTDYKDFSDGDALWIVAQW